MVDFSVWIESDFIEGFRDELFLAPVYIPVILLCLFILTVQEGLLNTIDKKCFKFEFRTKSSKFLQVQGVVIFLDILSKVLGHCSFN